MPVPYIENWHFTVNFPQHFETTADAQFLWGKFSVKCQFPIQGTGISHVISPKQTIIKFPTRNYTQLQGKLHVKCQFPIYKTGISQEISPTQTEHQLLLGISQTDFIRYMSNNCGEIFGQITLGLNGLSQISQVGLAQGYFGVRAKHVLPAF